MASLIKTRIDKTVYKLEMTSLILENSKLSEKVSIVLKIKNEKNLLKKFGFWVYSKALKKI